MGTSHPTSPDLENIHPNDSAAEPQKLDAGALFVLKSKGSWVHCGYHLTTSIVAPALLSLPFAFASLGWVAGIICLIAGASVTFYSYNLLSIVLEHHAQLGRRQLRFRDMANDIFGHSNRAPKKDYSLLGDHQDRVFGAFNAIAIIATTYGNGIIPEIQATAAAPVTGKMFKGLCLCYTVVAMTFFSVTISGYWAFGNHAQGTILSNFIVDGTTLVPKWFLMMTDIFTLLQLSAVSVVYLQPTNELLEGLFADPNKKQYSPRNVTPRFISRSLSVATATLIASMLPFFGDINAVIGAFGFLPLDFVVPSVFYNITFRPSKRSAIFWVNTAIAVVFSLFSVVGSISAVRQIVLDANNYKLFANV